MSLKVLESIRTLALIGVAASAVSANVAWSQETNALTPGAAPAGAAGMGTTEMGAAPTGPASAGIASTGSVASDDKSEIVVTGTLLRNVAPPGAQTINLDPGTIKATGAISTDQLLESIPQLTTFNNLQTGNQGGTQITVNRINLRNLPQGTGGSSPTLVLMDGHRLVGVGVSQSYPDPDVIPPALIQRVDVLTDGGSASYGSDAVGGVVNFITKRDFDGIQPQIRQGFADDYRSTDINLTVGKKWSTGGFFVGYNFSRHSALEGADRDYIRNLNYTTGLPQDLSCSPANVVQGGGRTLASGGTLYAVNNGTTLTPGTGNLCDQSKTKNYYPREIRNSVLGGFHQSLTSSLEFEVKGYYSNRNDRADNGPLQPSATVSSTNPNYISTGGGSTATQTVYFDLGPVGGREIIKTRLWAYGITPSLTWKIGSQWQAKAYYNYGQSKTTANDPGFNAVALGSGVAAGTINPYNIATSDPAAIAPVLDYTNHGVGRDKLSNAKLVVDGPLFRLPGGDVRVAVGGEYIHESYHLALANNSTYENVPNVGVSTASRDVGSGFGELNIPVVSRDNHIPLINSFTIAAAVRYDHYSDFGANYAPNVGATWKPIEWVSIRGRWNKSFQAPSLVQLSQAAVPSVGVFPGAIVNAVALLQNPAVPPNGGPVVAVQGTLSPLQPQRARDYDIGFDVSPPVAKGLNLHFTYYNIDYTGSISAPPLGSGPFYGVPTFNSLYIMLPSIAQIQTFLQNAGGSPAAIANAIASVNAQGGNAYIVADIRARNLGVTKTDGFDFGFDYHHPVSFGSIDVSYSATYIKDIDTANDGVNFLPNLAGVAGGNGNINNPRFNAIARFGGSVGDDIRGVITWNHSGGEKLTAPAQLNQTHVGTFNTVDLFVEHDIKHHGLPPISLSLTVTNIADARPPLYRGVFQGTAGGYLNGSTIGRLFQFGASVQF